MNTARIKTFSGLESRGMEIHEAAFNPSTRKSVQTSCKSYCRASRKESFSHSFTRVTQIIHAQLTLGKRVDAANAPSNSSMRTIR